MSANVKEPGNGLRVKEAFGDANSLPKKKSIVSESASNPEELVTFGGKVKKATLESIDDLTMHGLPNIFRGEFVAIRVLWLFLTVISAGACVFFIKAGIDQYNLFGVTTTIRVQNDYMTEFPAVTICNINPFTTVYGADVLSSVSMRYHNMNLESYVSYIMSLSDSNAKKAAIVTFINRALQVALSNYTDAQRAQMSYSFGEMELNCMFGTEQCRSQNSDWERYYHSTYGNCYTFNGQKSNVTYKTTRIGRVDGFILEVFVGAHERIQPLVSSYGLLVKVHNRTELPYDLSGNEVAAGTETSIAVAKTIVEQEPSPYSSCLYTEPTQRFDSKLYQMIQDSGYLYTQQYCFDVCLQRMTIRECGCYNQLYPTLALIDSQSQPCFRSPLSFNCSENFEQAVYSSGSMLSDQCTDDCPLECNRFELATSVSFSLYPSPEYAEFMLITDGNVQNKYANATIMKEQLNSNVLKLNVYFDALTHTEIIEQPSVSIVTLFSNIGGTLGLFLGMSLLSAFEFFEMIVQVIFIWFEHRKSTRKVAEQAVVQFKA